jgi:hypothetical protein
MLNSNAQTLIQQHQLQWWQLQAVPSPQLHPRQHQLLQKELSVLLPKKMPPQMQRELRNAQPSNIVHLD